MALANQPAKAPTADLAEGSSGPAASPITPIVAGDAPIAIPQASLLFDADFVRSGDDLTLVGHDGQELLIANYFGAGAPDLIAPNQAMLDGQTVTLLAGPQFPGQYAQAGGATQPAEPIGSVETLQGTVTAQRADGTTHELKVGDPVFESDVVTTGPGSNIGMKLADGTLVTLQESGKLAINAFVYQADGADNSALLNVIQGTFSLFAGQVAPTGDMQIKTPIATMGIRGTSILGVNVDAILGRLSLTQDPDGHVGFIEIFNNQNGNLFTVLRTVFEKITISESGLLSLTPKTPEELGIDQTLTELLHNFYNQVPQQGPDTSPQPQSGSPRFETPNIQEIIFDPAGPLPETELLLPQELLEQFLESLLEIQEIRDEIILALSENPSAGQIVLDDQLEADAEAGEGDGEPVETTLPFDFGSSGPGSVGFAALDGEPVVDANGQPVTNGDVPLFYAWDPATNTLTAVIPGDPGAQDDIPVFTIVVDPTTGEVTVTINGAVDHLGGNDLFLPIDIPFTVQAANGATATGTLTVVVGDDVPIFSNPEGNAPGVSNAIVDEDDSGAEQGDSVDGTLKVDFGADGFGSTEFTGAFQVPNAGSGALVAGGEGIDSGLTSDSQPVLFRLLQGSQVIEGYVAGENGQDQVILRVTLDGNDAGYEVELLGNIDHQPPNDTNNRDDAQSLNFIVAASDGDGDSIEAKLSVRIKDDAPVAHGSGTKTVSEDTDAAGAFVPDTVTGQLQFDAGADGATVTDVTYRFGGSILDQDDGGFPAFTSGGEPVSIETTTGEDGVITMTGTADGNPVFTFVIQPDGSYAFTLEAPIDHPDEGEAGAQDYLRMVFDFEVTDTDGDTSTSWFQIDIQDGEPLIDSSGKLMAKVDENDLDSSAAPGPIQVLADGTSPGDADGSITNFDGSASPATALDLGMLVLPGADQPLNFSLKNAATLGDADGPLAVMATDENGDPVNQLTSEGEGVFYTGFDNSIAGQTTLTASAGGRVVFTLTLTQDGQLSFTLFDNIDHLLAGDPGTSPTPFEDGLCIDLSGLVDVTDFDGDPGVQDGQPAEPAPILGEDVRLQPADFTGDTGNSGLVLDLRNFLNAPSGDSFTFNDLGQTVADPANTTLTYETLAGNIAQAFQSSIQQGSQTTLTGTEDNDILIAGPSFNNDDLIANGGDDLLINFGGGAGDEIDAGDGDDTVILNDDAGRMQGGAGLDQVFVVNSATFSVAGITGFEHIEILPAAGSGEGVIQNRSNSLEMNFSETTLVNVHEVLGGANADEIYTAGSHQNAGGDGVVLYDGENPGNPNDFGTDRIFVTIAARDFAGASHDTALFKDLAEFSVHTGQSLFTFDDTPTLPVEFQNFDRFFLNYQTAAGAFVQAGNGDIQINTGLPGGTLTGDGDNDVLIGGRGVNGITLNGEGGDDLLVATGGGIGRMNGGEGNDTLISVRGSGSRQIDGGDGVDQLFVLDTSLLKVHAQLTGVEFISFLDTADGEIRDSQTGDTLDLSQTTLDGVSLVNMANGSTVNGDTVTTRSQDDHITYQGNGAKDVLNIVLTTEQLADPAVQAEILDFHTQGGSSNFVFSTLNLTNDGFTTVNFLDGASNQLDPNNPGDFFGGVNFVFDPGQIVVKVMDDAPMAKGDLWGLKEAGPDDDDLEPAGALLTQTVNNALNTLPDNPGRLTNVLSTVRGEVGGLAAAIVVVWDFLDDAYVLAASGQVDINKANINEAFVRLGVEYAAYVKDGGAPLTDVTAKFTGDNDNNGYPDRVQSLHDNLLGNLEEGVLNGRFSDDADLLSELKSLIQSVDPDGPHLLDRPYYGGYEGEDPTTTQDWDTDNGFASQQQGGFHGNVLINDDLGADGGEGVISLVVDGTVHTPENGDILEVMTLQGGKLTFNFATGDWEYLPASDDYLNAGQGNGGDEPLEYVDYNGLTYEQTPPLPYENFRYTIQDGDGDTSTASLTIVLDPEEVDQVYQGGEDTDVLDQGQADEVDVLVGGEGKDVFVLNGLPGCNFDVSDFIADYNYDDEGDVIDLTALLEAYNANSNNDPVSSGDFLNHVSYDSETGNLSVDSTVVATVGNTPSNVTVMVDDSGDTHTANPVA